MSTATKKLNATERRERFRAILAGNELVYAPHVWDPVSARVAEDLGFEVGVFSAHAAEWMVTGGIEMCRVTLTELAEQARRICRASNISVLITGPFGFGNALNVMRAVEELENAGISALAIEDTVLPLTFGSVMEGGQKPVYDADLKADSDAAKTVDVLRLINRIDDQAMLPLEEAVGRYRAALAARQDPSFVIGARSNMFVVGDIQEAVRRAAAYAKAGAELIWLTSPTGEGLKAVHQATKVPLVPGGGILKDPTIPGSHEQFLIANGVRIASAGGANFTTTVKANYDALLTLRDGLHAGKSIDALRPPVPSVEIMARIMRVSQDDEWIKEFMN